MPEKTPAIATATSPAATQIANTYANGDGQPDDGRKWEWIAAGIEDSLAHRTFSYLIYPIYRILL